MNRLLFPLMTTVLWAVVLLLSAARLTAQDAARPPVILRFAADEAAVDLDAVERGSAEVTLRWQVGGARADAVLVLEAWQLGGWQPVRPLDAPPLPLVGDLTLPVWHPLNYDTPAFRLSLYVSTDAGSAALQDSHLLTLRYRPLDAEQTPEIVRFSSSSEAVPAAALQNGSARVPVSWDLIHRPPGTNLVFEQLINDTPVSVELPRTVDRVGSVGSGPTAPRFPGTGAPVVLRLSLVDRLSGEALVSAELSIPVTGGPTPEGLFITHTPTFTPTGTAAPRVTPTP